MMSVSKYYPLTFLHYQAISRRQVAVAMLILYENKSDAWLNSLVVEKRQVSMDIIHMIIPNFIQNTVPEQFYGLGQKATEHIWEAESKYV